MVADAEAEGPFDVHAALARELAAARAAFALDDAVTAVHQGRVRLKRIRALARLAIPKDRAAAQALNTAARAAMAGLSDSRDLAAQEAVAARAGLTALAAALATRRGALGPPPLAAARRRLAAVAKAIAALPPLTSDDIEAGVRRLARRARKACARARDARDPEARHTWRKREKDRLHVVIALGPSWPRALRRRRQSGKRLARALGAERDVLLLLDLVRTDAELTAIAGEGGLAHLLARSQTLAARADRLGRAVHRKR